jgi:hypothetical protein
MMARTFRVQTGFATNKAKNVFTTSSLWRFEAILSKCYPTSSPFNKTLTISDAPYNALSECY